MATAMPSSSRRRNSAGATPARPASARAVLAAVTLSPPLADHGTLAYRRSGTHAYRRMGERWIDERWIDEQWLRRVDGREARGDRGPGGQAAGRTAGDDHGRGLGHRAQPGPAAVGAWLAGGHRRHRRGRAQGDRADAARARAGPGARRAGRRG